MTFRLFISFIILALVSALPGCSSPLQQGRDLGDPAPISQAPAPAKVVAGEGLHLIVKPLKSNLELGEPVYLALRVTNKLSKTVTLIGNLKPGEGFVEIYSQGPKGEKILLPPLSDADFGNKIPLEPGQTIGDVVPVFFGANGWNFKSAGKYMISAELKVPTGKNSFIRFKSNSAVLNIQPSSSGLNLFNIKDKRARVETGKFLLWRTGDHLKAGMDNLNRISKQNTDSALSSYIMAAHIQNYSEPFTNYITKKVRIPDCTKANALRKSLNRKRLTENLLIEDYISQAKCSAVAKRWDEARNALDAAEKLAGDRPEFQPYATSISLMKKRLKKYIR